MSRRRLIVAAGYTPLDAITSHDCVRYAAGGTASNVGAILACLGWEAVVAAQVGDDLAGEMFVADLCDASVDTSQLHIQSGMATPRLIHVVRPDGHFFRYRCDKCGRRLPRSRPLTLDQAGDCARQFPRPDVFFFDRVNAGTLLLAEHYSAAGSVVVFEPSVPANAELLRRAVAVADVVKHSDDRSVGGLSDLGVGARAGQIRVVTHGAEGLEWRVGKRRRRRLPALATMSVDSGGAGDWTTGGLIHKAAKISGLSEERIEDGLLFGQALAALNCTAIGARGLMDLAPSTIHSHVRRVRSDGGVVSAPRFPSASREAPRDVCAVCALPEEGEQLQIASGL